MGSIRGNLATDKVELVQPAACMPPRGLIMKHPQARTAGLVTVSDQDELIVQTSDGLELARLSAHEARIWRAADGLKSVQQLASSLTEPGGDGEGAREEVVWQALDRLGDLGLLEARAAPAGAVPFMSRRNLLTRAAAASVASVAAVAASDAFLAAAAAETNANSVTCLSRNEDGGAPNRVESAVGSRGEPAGALNRVESATGSRGEPAGARNRVASARGSNQSVSQQEAASQVLPPVDCNPATPDAGATTVTPNAGRVTPNVVRAPQN